MNPAHRGRAMMARAHRPLTLATLVGVWAFQGAVSIQPTSPMAQPALSRRQAPTVRADLIDDIIDIIDDVFGDPNDPPPDEEGW